MSLPCALAGRKAPLLWSIPADKQEKVNCAHGGTRQASASGGQWQSDKRWEAGSRSPSDPCALWGPGVCEGRQVLPWAHCPGQGWAPGQAELASARPSPGSPGEALGRGGVGGTGGRARQERGRGRGRLESKNADAEDNELSEAEATHLVPATLY